MIVESPTTHSNLDGPISLKFHTQAVLRALDQSRRRAGLVNQRRSQVKERGLVPLPGLIVDYV
jgi:hypothetical protein